MPTQREEKKLYRQGYSKIAGVDEAGRGAWAGPLVAAAVILPRHLKIPGLNDSKKLTAKAREVLFKKIIDQSVAYTIYRVSQKIIDKQGVGKANLLAIQKSVKFLPTKPHYVLIDGLKVKIDNLPVKSVVRGDAKVISIAAASILAKVSRDRIMVKYHKKFPQYNFAKHKGYGTKEHYANIKKYGICPLHRLSFSPLNQLD